MRRVVALTLALALAAGGAFSFAAPARATSISGGGMVHGGMYSEQWEAGADLNNMAAVAGRKVTFGGTFASVFENDNGFPNTVNRLENIWEGQATPFVNLEFKAGVSAFAIAAGHYDSKIHSWADYLKSWLDMGGGRTLVLAPLQEMNGNWTSYGCDPGNFKQAYRRIVDIVRSKGINETKVRFAFAPNAWSGCYSITDYYPGDSYVDIIGISAYRWSDGGSVNQVMGQYLDQLASWYPTKPLVVSQTAAWVSSSKSQWIRDMFAYTASHPHVVATLWFNFNGETDWRVWKNGSVDAGWRDGMQSSSTAYQWPLTDWFQPGSLTLGMTSGVTLCHGDPDCDTVALQDWGGKFHVWKNATGGEEESSFFFGNPGDVPFSGDWNCDGVDTVGLYRRSDGYVYLRNSNTQGVADITFFFGNPGDLPVAGDFDGDGCDTVSIYRPSLQGFYIINRLGEDGGGLGAADYSFMFGDPGDKPFVGDFNADGVDTIGLHRESTGLVYFRNNNSTGVADFEFIFGDPGDKILAGDWDGDGDDTVGVYRPGNGLVYLRNSNTQGIADAWAAAGSYAGFVALNK